MKNALTALFLLLLWAASSPEALCQSPVHARTDAGKEVVLYPDGTWKYSAEPGPGSARGMVYRKPALAQKLFKPDRGSFGIWYDENRWHLQPKGADDKLRFRLATGDGYAMVLVEELPVPLSTLRKIALLNARNAAPDARVTLEETRIVNGKELLCMKMEGTIEQIPFVYYGYYYGGKEGTIQLVTFTGQSLFDKYQPEFTNLLNGLEIY